METGEVRSDRDELMPRSLIDALAPEYSLLRPLGSGAFGDVYEARQTSTGQSVAIKVLRATEDVSARRRFLREMRACAALHHPNVVRVLDAGRDLKQDAGLLFTVFEYVPGKTLAERLAAEGMLKVDVAVQILGQVLDALQAAHRVGIVHRDLKPANIMVTETASGPHAKVLDFGVSGWLQSSWDAGAERMTRSGERVGTPAYCAPEQLRGEPTSVLFDHYAWGLVLLECLTGEHPFGRGSMQEFFQAQFSSGPVPLPAVLAKHPLGDLLRWTLEKSPARRASSAEQILARLRQLDLCGLADSAGFLAIGPSSANGREESPATELALLTPPRQERRPVTVLCGRVSLPRGIPVGEEDALDEWLSDLWETLARVAERNGGRLTSGGGSEFTTYFGLGREGEVSARSAARAALEIRDHCVRRTTLIRARAGWTIDIHFGLHQGMVTVDFQPIPRVSHLNSIALSASRMCQLAPPNDIAASQSTVSLLPGVGRFERQTEDPSLGPLAWYRLSAESGGVLSSATVEDGLVPYTIGREAELEELEAVWQAEGGFRFRCVVLRGEAGIGKTHLASGWTRRLVRSGCHAMVARCLPETRSSALQPILDLLREQLGLRDGTPDQAATKVERFLVEQGLAHSSNVHLLREWLGLPSDAPFEPTLSPKKRRDQLLALVAELLGRLSAGPSVLFIEDVHWADPSTIECMHLLSTSDVLRRPLLLCTLRQEVDALGAAHKLPFLDEVLSAPTTRIISLNPLTATSARAFVAELWGTNENTALVVERGAGVPFFLLELVRCGVAAGDFAVPPSIAELLRIRMEQLGGARETAQLAAVIGPEFELELLGKLSRRSGELLGDLNQLQNAGVVVPLSEGRYAFAHALLRENAYQSLPLRDRQRYHGGVAAELLQQHESLGVTKPWLLAHHYFNAGELGRAVAHGETAAAQAIARFDNFEALDYVRELKGSDSEVPAGWLRKLGADSKQDEIELRLLALEATALMLTRGWADVALSKACQRATQLFDKVPAQETVPMRYVLAQYFFSTGWSFDEARSSETRARPHIDALIDVASAGESRAFRGLGLMMLAALRLFSGDLEASLETARAVEPFDDQRAAWRYGYDAWVCARSIESQALWLRGDERAEAVSEETLQLAETLGHPATHANALLYSLTALHLSGDRRATARRCDELCALCERTGIQGFPAYAMIFKGWAEGNPALASSMLNLLLGAGQHLCEVYCRTIVAEAELDAGHHAPALEHLQQAEERSLVTGERFILPQVYLLRARLANERDPKNADAFLGRALDLVRQQGAHGLRARIESEARKLRALRFHPTPVEQERRPEASEA